MNELLSKTLSCIEKEAGEFDLSFELVDEVIRVYGEVNIAARLYDEVDSSVSWKAVADLYAILIWSTSDNGLVLTQTTEQWIVDCSDERKVLIALNLDVYPFKESESMKLYLSNVIEQFPALKDNCNKLLKSRLEQNS